MTYAEPHRIVIVGGGAGGLELATRLGNTLGRRQRAQIILIDDKLTHLWKPLLHEVAAGTLDASEDELDYLAHARAHHFHFRLGRLAGLDRRQHAVTLEPVVNDDGVAIIPARRVSYDTLVIAIGSITNDFGTPGADRYCTYLDTPAQAERFRRRFLDAYIQSQYQAQAGELSRLDIAIIGAGATGVELAAELRATSRYLSAYGLDRIDPTRDVAITLIEALDRILPPLPASVAQTTLEDLQHLGVAVFTGETVTEVTAQGVRTANGRFIPASLMVWSAGVKAPALLGQLDGLEVNARNQLVVRPTLQTSRDDTIFAFGDCAACESQGKPVPPRAQAAHQQARLLATALRRRLQGRPLPPYVYKDYGSLISLSRFHTVGTLMGNLIGRVRLEGRLARLVYLSLHKQHQVALHGVFRVALLTLANGLRRSTKPRLKLH